MKQKIIILAGLCAALIVVAGCGPSRVEMDYGTSYQLQKFNQTLNPEAERNLEPVTGLSGQAVQGNLDKYQKGFEKESAAATTYQFSLGSMGGE